MVYKERHVPYEFSEHLKKRDHSSNNSAFMTRTQRQRLYKILSDATIDASER